MRPEHFDLSCAVFLPIAHETCRQVLESGPSTLTALTNPELAALLVIQDLAQAPQTYIAPGGAAESLLARLINWAVDARHSPSVGLLSEAQRLFDSTKLHAGLERTKDMNLRFLLPEEVSAGEYLLPSGKWDVAYKIRQHRNNDPFSNAAITPRDQERWLTCAQDKLLRTFRANLDEHLHVQGYAGIGKSHLIGALMECLRPERTLLLACTAGKLATLRMRSMEARDRKRGWTFEQFALFLLHGPNAKPITARAGIQSKTAVAQELGIIGIHGYSPSGTLDICLNVIELYCHSADYALSSKHLPHPRQDLSGLERKVIVEYSSRVWTYLEAHSAWANQLDFRVALLLKWANLKGCVLPARYTHVLVDESQDIPLPLLQIVERGRQVLITLGDEYQHARGEPAKRKPGVRQSDISYSVRSGRNIEQLVNPLISNHSNKGKAYFEGSKEADVEIKLCALDFVPPAACVVLAASRWDMMKWAISLYRANGIFSFPTKVAQKDLKHFMATAIALFRPDLYSTEQTGEGWHPELRDFFKWQQVRESYQFDESFRWVEAELDKGFRAAELNQLVGDVGYSAKSCMLMRAEEAGGMEFDNVLLTPGLLTLETFKDKKEFDERSCALYIAISRAKQQLYLPYEFLEWFEYHKSRPYRQPLGF